MKKTTLLAASLLALNVATAQTYGPLFVHPTNGRYFADSTGAAVLLVGSHTWTNLLDSTPHDPPHVFNNTAWLDFMVANGHNFQRLWSHDQLRRGVPTQTNVLGAPHPWPRTGPGNAIDGKPRFDLLQHDQAYFDRLRARVIASRDRGIYCAVMFFEGHALHRDTSHSGWHPFHLNNNVNSIDGDADNNGDVAELQTLQANVAAITAIQEDYVRKCVDTLNDLDNVLWEITNEGKPGSANSLWQYHMIDVVRAHEATKPVQHPIGMTVQWPVEGATASNAALAASSADWISPGLASGADYQNNPPVANGSKVSLVDTDHVNSTGGHGATWGWKNFLRGHNPIYMDPWDKSWLSQFNQDLPLIRAMGHCRAYSLRVDLAGMTPQGSLASSGYALVGSAAGELLVWFNSGHHKRNATGTINLSGLPGVFALEWFNPGSAAVVLGSNVNGGGTRTLTVPWKGSAGVAFLKRI